VTSKKRKGLHVYFTEGESARFDVFLDGLCKIGRVKVRRGDVITTILSSAMDDNAFLSVVRRNMLKQTEDE